jgi:hypothetical protein
MASTWLGLLGPNKASGLDLVLLIQPRHQKRPFDLPPPLFHRQLAFDPSYERPNAEYFG